MRKGKDVLAMVFALEVLVPVMLISMEKVVSMQFVLITAANMALATWKPTAVCVMKDGQVMVVTFGPSILTFNNIFQMKDLTAIRQETGGFGQACGSLMQLATNG